MIQKVVTTGMTQDRSVWRTIDLLQPTWLDKDRTMVNRILYQLWLLNIFNDGLVKIIFIQKHIKSKQRILLNVGAEYLHFYDKRHEYSE